MNNIQTNTRKADMRILIRYDENSENALARAGMTLGKLAIAFGAVSIGYVPGLFVLDTRAESFKLVEPALIKALSRIETSVDNVYLIIITGGGTNA